MPETRTTSQRLQLAAVNFAGALVLAFIAWKAAAWAFDFIAAANDSGLSAGRGRVGTVPVAIFLVAGFAALLALGAIANAAYLTFRRED
jgi:hypothetical protein